MKKVRHAARKIKGLDLHFKFFIGGITILLAGFGMQMISLFNLHRVTENCADPCTSATHESLLNTTNWLVRIGFVLTYIGFGLLIAALTVLGMMARKHVRVSKHGSHKQK